MTSALVLDTVVSGQQSPAALTDPVRGRDSMTSALELDTVAFTVLSTKSLMRDTINTKVS
jgi:hypothetical protein